MTRYLESADGTRIAFDLLGDGLPLVIVSGLLCDRQRTRELAEALARDFAVVNYDRRGRGDSGYGALYEVEREVEDLAALIAAVGGDAAVYGHSSGAGLALRAAALGLPISRLVLHEPPYGPDDEDSMRSSRELAGRVGAALAEDRRADAVALFMAASGMPPEMASEIAADPRMRALAPTMPYDFAVMGDVERGGTIPEDVVRAVAVPTLVLAGGASPAFFRDTTERIAELLPDGRHEVLDGQDHGATASAVAPVVGAFLAGQPAANRSASP
jgi:pimeloyl-ACP methyl ester carboxylesterase